MTCRFYGKHQTVTGLMIEQMGNQCGAITSHYGPCKMELAGQTPDAEACPIAIDARLRPQPHGGAGTITILDPESY
jgi:hypothetical protein